LTPAKYLPGSGIRYLPAITGRSSRAEANPIALAVMAMTATHVMAGAATATPMITQPPAASLAQRLDHRIPVTRPGFQRPQQHPVQVTFQFLRPHT
jgi:hypothetical protein